jgi:hypothetical protein
LAPYKKKAIFTPAKGFMQKRPQIQRNLLMLSGRRGQCMCFARDQFEPRLIWPRQVIRE